MIKERENSDCKQTTWQHLDTFGIVLFPTAKNSIARMNVFLLMSNWRLSRDDVDFPSIFQPNQENTAQKFSVYVIR